MLSAEASLKHAFTTRLGGNSQPPLNSFNLGRHTDNLQEREEATHNRKHLCEALRLENTRIIAPKQVHSNIVLWLGEPENGFKELDGLATSTPNLSILLTFADCVPIIIFSRQPKAICVIHAGWRGTAGSIARNGVLLMKKMLNAKTTDMIAAIGPAIESCCYPTSNEIANKLTQTVQNNRELIVYRNKKPHPDLKAINAMQLCETGIGQIDISNFCTACHPKLFYSHRQSGGKTGRQGCIASLTS